MGFEFGTWNDAAFGGKLAAKVGKSYRDFAQRRVNKTLAQTVISDNYFKVCDEDDPAMRYGIWGNQEDLIIPLLRPVTNTRKEINVQYIDFRGLATSSAKGSSDWCAFPATAARSGLGTCTLRYCFNFDKHYAAFQEALTPNFFADSCKRDSIFTIDGSEITNEADYQRFLMLNDMKASMLTEVVGGTGTGNSVSKGLRKFFLDFATDHPELGEDCVWNAPTVVTASQECASFGDTLEARIKALKYLAKDVRIQGTGQVLSVNPEDFVLLMNEKTAECLIKCHVCQDVCGTQVAISAMSPEQLRAWKGYVKDYLQGGLYGQGYFVSTGGMVFSIMRSTRLNDGEVYLLYTGGQTNPEGGIRLVMNDYTNYVNYLRTENSAALDDVQPTLYGGTVVVFKDYSHCGNKWARWGWSLFDRQPWLQTLYTTVNLTGCTFALPTPFPAAPAVVPITPNC